MGDKGKFGTRHSHARFSPSGHCQGTGLEGPGDGWSFEQTNGLASWQIERYRLPSNMKMAGGLVAARHLRHLANKSQIVLPNATAVSAIRFEKPHSLSYHDITRTRLPSMTLVWSSAKVEEAGLWFRSMETIGSSV